MNQLIGSYARQSWHVMVAFMRILNCKTTSSLCVCVFFIVLILLVIALFHYLNLARILIARTSKVMLEGPIIYLYFLHVLFFFFLFFSTIINDTLNPSPGAAAEHGRETRGRRQP